MLISLAAAIVFNLWLVRPSWIFFFFFHSDLESFPPTHREKLIGSGIRRHVKSARLSYLQSISLNTHWTGLFTKKKTPAVFFFFFFLPQIKDSRFERNFLWGLANKHPLKLRLQHGYRTSLMSGNLNIWICLDFFFFLYHTHAHTRWSVPC